MAKQSSDAMKNAQEIEAIRRAHILADYPLPYTSRDLVENTAKRAAKECSLTMYDWLLLKEDLLERQQS